MNEFPATYVRLQWKLRIEIREMRIWRKRGTSDLVEIKNKKIRTTGGSDRFEF